MASAQVVETSVNTNNSPSQDYTTNRDDHSNHNIVCFLMKISRVGENITPFPWELTNYSKYPNRIDL